MSTQELKNKLRRFYRQNQYLPSIRELCTYLGKAETYRTQAKRVLDKLVEEGFLAQNEQGKYLPGGLFFAYPLLYGLKAGQLTPIGDLINYIQLDNLLISDPENTIMLSVSGDSMQGVIDDGDIVVADVRKKPRYGGLKKARRGKSGGEDYGDVVVVQVGSEYTVKYLQKDSEGKPFLKPANPNYPDIYFGEEEEVRLVAVVTRAIRKF